MTDCNATNTLHCAIIEKRKDLTNGINYATATPSARNKPQTIFLVRAAIYIKTFNSSSQEQRTSKPRHCWQLSQITRGRRHPLDRRGRNGSRTRYTIQKTSRKLTKKLAEEVRFELTDGFPSPVFKTGALDHSATLPDSSCKALCALFFCCTVIVKCFLALKMMMRANHLCIVFRELAL